MRDPGDECKCGKCHNCGCEPRDCWCAPSASVEIKEKKKLDKRSLKRYSGSVESMLADAGPDGAELAYKGK